jgi:glycosyltransferase involved in cell wall biosynthesis
MACGTPVITSNTTSLPEIAGGAALLVDPMNEDDIAGAILKIVREESLRSTLRTKSLAHAAHLSWDASAAQTRRVLEDRRNG